ncbi:hypothetical protein PVAP13_1NG316319 [Panicum virgatum]|uniref:Uncharacterized protein n=1 Tax=Panicum virgatum TaxID=38727 RepID=A0A8T0X8E8_PANVG|nr:hypothetical protein PVAP13_1NG316319 [Panicum virgatum]
MVPAQRAGSELMPLSKFSKTTGRAIQLTRPYSNSNSRGKEYQGQSPKTKSGVGFLAIMKELS